MPDHTIFNERPESQDRALKVIERLGYTIVPRSEAERKRGSRKAVLFTEELQAWGRYCQSDAGGGSEQRGRALCRK